MGFPALCADRPIAVTASSPITSPTKLNRYIGGGDKMGLPSNPFAGAGGVHATLIVVPDSATSRINIRGNVILAGASTFLE